jgi:3-phytase
VAGSNRSRNSIDLFEVDPATGSVRPLSRLPLAMEEPYGLCMGRTPEVSIFVGDPSGNVEHWIIDDELGGRRAAVFEFDTQTEGCVYDPADGRLFVGEEDRGIWAVDPATGAREVFDRVGDGFLVADVEGLDIYADPDTGRRYLLASSQGDHTFVIYGLPDGERLLKFAVVGDRSRGIDGAEDSDGVAVISAELPGYPEGLLVVQDGYNRNPRQTQNFKGIDWRRIRSHLP